MAYGLRINKADGTVTYDSSATAFMQVAQLDVAAQPADVNFVAGTTYNIGDYVRTGSGGTGTNTGERWKRINSSGSTSSDPQTENTANIAAGNPVNWENGAIVLMWDNPLPAATGNSDLRYMEQLIDQPPDDQEAYLPHISLNYLGITIKPFRHHTSERVIITVLAKVT